MAYYDEICSHLKERMDMLFDEKSTNFVYLYAKVHQDNMYPLDTLSLFWPEINRQNREWIKCHNRMIGEKNTDILKKIIRESENYIREKADLPSVGESWISETVLYKQIKTVFNDIRVEQHFSPSFLGRQHYDVFLPDYNIAIEYQGEQHNKPIDFFGGEKSFLYTKERDLRKKSISEANGIVLIEVFPDYSLDSLIDEICEIIGETSYKAEYKSIKNSIKKQELSNDLRRKVVNLNSMPKQSSKKEITAKEKIEAKAKLKSIKTRFEEGYWIQIWYYAFILSHAEKLDYSVEDIDGVIEELKKKKVEVESPNDKPFFADCFKRGINYYKKKKMYDKAIELAEYAINRNLHLEKAKDFDERLDELLRKKRKEAEEKV